MTSENLFKSLRELNREAENAIYELMTKHGINEINLAQDENGNCPGDKDYCFDIIPLEVMCYNKCDTIDYGYITRVYIDNGSVYWDARSYDGDDYSNGYVENNAIIGAEILSEIEKRLEK